jgi:hypothetical protein
VVPTVLLVGGLIMGAVLTAWTVGPSATYSFSGQISQVYLWVSTLLIAVIGWSPRTFPMAAAFFYAFLPIAQSAGTSHQLMGTWDQGLAYELIPAIPLILCGLLGPTGARAGDRVLPASVRWGWPLVLGCAALSTLLGESMVHAAPNYLMRFLIPAGAALATYRRCRSVQDYRIVILGFMLGAGAILAFYFRSSILGQAAYYATETGQRIASGNQGYSVIAYFTFGFALYRAHATSLHKSLMLGVSWLGVAATVVVLLWIGAHRAPIAFAGLVGVWWLVTAVFRRATNPRVVLLVVLGACAALAIGAFMLEHTYFDPQFILERFSGMQSHGLRGEARWPIWSRALSHFSSSPLWGRGPNSWPLFDTFFASVHSSVVGILIDTGLLGLSAFGLLFGGIWTSTNQRRLAHLNDDDRAYVLGTRTAWAFTLLLLSLLLPFTSGQMQNNVVAHIVYLYPGLAMVAYTRGAARSRAGRPAAASNGAARGRAPTAVATP